MLYNRGMIFSLSSFNTYLIKKKRNQTEKKNNHQTVSQPYFKKTNTYIFYYR